MTTRLDRRTVLADCFRGHDAIALPYLTPLNGSGTLWSGAPLRRASARGSGGWAARRPVVLTRSAPTTTQAGAAMAPFKNKVSIFTA